MDHDHSERKQALRLVSVLTMIFGTMVYVLAGIILDNDFAIYAGIWIIGFSGMGIVGSYYQDAKNHHAS